MSIFTIRGYRPQANIDVAERPRGMLIIDGERRWHGPSAVASRQVIRLGAGSLMTIILKPEQERAIQEAIEAGVIRSVDEFIEAAIESLPHGEAKPASREEAIRRMQEFGDKYHLSLGEPITRKLLHEGHRL